MKKTIAIVMLAVLLLGLLAACGGGKDSGNNKYLGTYKLSKLADMTVQEYADLFEMKLEDAQNFMTVELKSGGKAVFTSDDEPVEVSWKVEGEKLILSAEGESIEGTIKDGVIALDFDGEIIELAK